MKRSTGNQLADIIGLDTLGLPPTASTQEIAERLAYLLALGIEAEKVIEATPELREHIESRGAK